MGYDLLSLLRLAFVSLSDSVDDVDGVDGIDNGAELSGSLGVFKGGDDYQAVVDFDAWGADDVRGRRWHSSQELIDHSTQHYWALNIILPRGRLKIPAFEFFDVRVRPGPLNY